MAPMGLGHRALLAATVIVSLSGCLQATAPASQPDDAPVAAEMIQGADGRLYYPNLYLIDQPPMPGGRVSFGAEPVILADRNGQYLWVGDTLGVHRSANGGATWTTLADPIPLVADGYTLAQDEANHLYAATTSIPYIHFIRSDNNGNSWAAQNIPDAAPIADRPWIAARGNGEVSLIFYAFARPLFNEACVRSTDAGQTWLDRDVNVGVPQAGNLVYDTNGDLYYSNDAGTVVRMRESATGKCGGTLSSFQLVTSKGAQHMMAMAVNDGDIYVAAPTVGNGAIKLWGSTDFATRKSVTISPPDQLSNTFATISYHDGEIAVAWYASETAGDPSNANFAGSWNVYVAKVRDFWTATPNITTVRLTTAPNHVGDICMAGTGCGAGQDRDLLDYFGIDHSVNGTVHVAYGHDGAGSAAEVRYAQVA